MSKVTKKNFGDDRVHKEIREAAEDYLKTKGSFCFDEILVETGYENFAESINWKLVEGYLLGKGFALIAVNENYFKPIRDRYINFESGVKIKHVDATPDLFIAWGRGNKIDGFVTQETAPKSIIAAYVNSRNRVLEGAGVKMATKIQQMLDDNVIIAKPLHLNEHIEADKGGFRFLNPTVSKESTVRKAIDSPQTTQKPPANPF